ncbi:alanine racemase [Solibacillus sp. FSL H8-0538]|uniref:alanine racemase n=1 Tax=Solibacillus sp. FSL H8-0538 TaxID=2921400 RepID=UPI0030FB83DD
MENLTYYRPTKALIDLQAIKANIQSLRNYLQPHVDIIAVVKANAYGHGDIQVAAAAIEAGAVMLAVATPDEAVRIRQHFAHIDILVLGATPISFIPYAASENITLAVFSVQWVEQAQQIKSLQSPVKLHIKIDTGMGRIGVNSLEELLQLYEIITSTAQFSVDGIFTHFATADEEETLYFDKQVDKFKELLQYLPEKPRLVHVANTATALIKHSSLQFDAVRFGISMYGLLPSSYVGEVLPFPLRPALALETELVHVKKLHAGQSVGYGATFTAADDCYIGTIPIGYADGMIRKLSGQDVLVDGKRSPIIGRICMDQCMILLPAAYNVGERVTLVGKQQGEEITLDDWATKVETINYEVPCIITSRVPRIYIK